MDPKAISAALLLLIAWRLTPRLVYTADYESHLKDKVILVTDAGNALGTELVYSLASHGAKLFLVFSLSNIEKTLRVLSKSQNADPKERGMLTRANDKRKAIQDKALALGAPEVEVLIYDYGNVKGVAGIVEECIEMLEGLDYVVMNHEDVVRGYEHPPDTLTRSLNVNVLSYIQLLHTATQYLGESGDGHVFVSSSVLASLHSATLPVYSAAKHVLNSYISGVRQGLEEAGVSVTVGQLGEITMPDRQLLYNVPEFMRGDIQSGAQHIVDSLITRPRTLYYPKLHCVISHVMSLFQF